MKYVILFVLVAASIHPASFAKYNWDSGNKLGAIGVLLVTAAMIVYPAVILFTR